MVGLFVVVVFILLLFIERLGEVCVSWLLHPVDVHKGLAKPHLVSTKVTNFAREDGLMGFAGFQIDIVADQNRGELYRGGCC